MKKSPRDPEAVIQTVEDLLRRADSEGRRFLFEHEVYGILQEMGIRPPIHHLVAASADVTPELLSRFPSSRIVLKAASAGLAHKQRQGGVQVVLKDLEFIRYSLDRMAGAFADRGVELAGALLVEYVEYDKDLGNEILLGFRESDAFGPVLSFSKGGSDAEHFATHFSPPNIILAPVDRDWAHALLSSTQIHVKYLEEGKGGYVERIAEAAVRFSELAVGFSSFFPGSSSYVITEFEINPLVFDPYGRMIPLDGYAAFAPKERGSAHTAAAPARGLRAFFQPRGVAVVGVSATDPTKAGNIIVENLLELGRGDILCVNPKGGVLRMGDRELVLHRSVGDAVKSGRRGGTGGAATPPELAVLAVPAPAAPAVMEDCAASGVKAVLIVSGGFSEVTGDRGPEDRLLEIARRTGIRIMGPNCLGVVYMSDGDEKGMNTFFIPEEKFRVVRREKENVAILSQSGAVGIVEIYNLRNAVSPKVIVSYGNQIDVDPCDLVACFADDPHVEVMGLYIEGFRAGAGRRFCDISSRIEKPLVVYKAGRTEEGVQATASHTASIAGEYAVARAALKQAGLVVAETVLDHMGYIKTFALLGGRRVRGRRVAVVTNAGYEKTNAADNIGDLELAELDDRTLRRLEALLPAFVTVSSMLDLTPMVSDEEFAGSIDAMLASEQVDALCISIVPQAQLIHTTDQEIEGYRENVAARIVKSVRRHRKPAVASVAVESGADTNYNKFSQIMESGGVPTFLSAERAMMFLNAFVRYHLLREQRNLAERLR